ncbi:MAG: hypothetical protein H6923_07860 [Alphaproteobacteria bacterium]|nr:hypothetical protein [Alphaproteobacteria bacterium]
MSDPRSKNAPTRRDVVAAGAAIAGVSAAGLGGASAASPALVASAKGGSRALPERLFGVNSVVCYDVPFEDPAMVPAVEKLAPHYLRFPGGTVANYFNWRTGKLDVKPIPSGASVYRKYILDYAQPSSHRLHPGGAFMEDFAKIAKALDAETVFVPNLETSTVDEQTAWFAHLAEKGIAPRTVEMGNEFALAILMDKASLEAWPDYASSMARMKTYYEGFRKYLPDDARIAVQAAMSRLNDLEEPPARAAIDRREWEWDNALVPEDWFQAVTTHPYVGISSHSGVAALKGLPDTVDQVYPNMIAHTDDGISRQLRFIEEKLPGKEIWVTEWGGADAVATFQRIPLRFDGMWLNMMARSLLVFLRHPSVTVTNYHAMFFSGNLSSLFRRTSGPEKYAPINAASLFAWFNRASRGPGVTYTHLTIEGATRIEAKTNIPGEGFNDVEGGLFRKGDGAVALVHNAWKEPKTLDVSGLMDGRVPTKAEAMGADDLLAVYEVDLPPVRALAAGPAIVLPPYTTTRIEWA